MENKEKRAYLTIGSIRNLELRVILDDKEIIYEGRIENASELIKQLRYSKVEKADKMTFYVYSEFN